MKFKTLDRAKWLTALFSQSAIIKLIRKDDIGNKQLAEVYGEARILASLSHPNIVQFLEMKETEKYFGIVTEYASGGTLEDYISHHRYLKDHRAQRLFAQLVSGVGYLHKKGVVHRGIDPSHLLLDRNKNIIIIGFSCADTFDPDDELDEMDEINLSDRDYVLQSGLWRLKADGTRKGDLMDARCGTTRQRAPEMVLSDSLYTGRKVDVWNCGVVLVGTWIGVLLGD